ncbi:MAG TPA: hypothetical protein VIR27_08625, partial [Mycobacteriales bacterium]
MGKNKGQYPVTDSGIRTGTPENYGKTDDVRKMLLATNPTHVTQAGKTYRSVADRLRDSMTLLERQSRTLAQHWSGSDSSVKAQQALKLLHGQSSELSTKSYLFASTFEQCGTDYLQWYQDHIPGNGTFHTGGDDEYAQQYLQRLNVRYQQIFSYLPSTVEKNLPNVGGTSNWGGYDPVAPPKPNVGPGGPGTPGGGGPLPTDPFGSPGGLAGPGGVPSGPGITPSSWGDPSFTDPVVPPGGPGGLGDLDDGSTSLAGFDPPGSTGGYGSGGYGSGGLGSTGGYGSGGYGSTGGYGSGGLGSAGGY